jgi:hypothetical protein
MTGDPHHPVSPTTLIHVVPEGGVVGGVDCGVSLTGVSTMGGSGKTVTGGVTGVGVEGVLPPHEVAAKAHHMTATAFKIRGRARMKKFSKPRLRRGMLPS